jgi:hypothetical protein
MERYYNLLSYVVDALSGKDIEIDRAIQIMDEYRCSLTNASDFIVDTIDDAIRAWCEDNDVDYYNFDTYLAFEKDIEDVFWDAVETLE